MNLVKVPNVILRHVSRPVVDQDISELVEEMSRIRQENNGVGLAAPQVGVLLRVINIFIRGKEITIINPETTNLKGAQNVQEGCLSIPGKLYSVIRPVKITVTGTDIRGNKITIRCRADETPIVVHEVEHLNGILIDKYGKLVATFTPENKDKIAFGEKVETEN
jgi:peptide deformylase